MHTELVCFLTISRQAREIQRREQFLHRDGLRKYTAHATDPRPAIGQLVEGGEVVLVARPEFHLTSAGGLKTRTPFASSSAIHPRKAACAR